MISRLAALIASVFTSLQVNASSAKPVLPTDRIAIIGGGVCGLATARELLHQGIDLYNIEIFEANATAGGKVSSIMYEGRSYEMGAQVVVPTVYGPIIDLIHYHGLKLRKPNVGTIFDLSKGRALNFFETAASLPKFALEMLRYKYLYETKWKNVGSPDGYEKISDELNNHDWSSFVEKYDFHTIEAAVAAFVGGGGYLSHDKLPTAAQMISILNPNNISILALEGTRMIDGGYQRLWQLESDDHQ